MTSKLSRRLENLERFSSANIERHSRGASDCETALDEIRALADAWHAQPENQRWLAAQPRDHLVNGMRQLKVELEQMASGRPVTRAGGFN